MSDSLTMRKVVDHLYTLREGDLLYSTDVHYIQSAVSFFYDYEMNRDYNEAIIDEIREQLAALKDTVPEVEEIIKRLGYVYL